MKVLKLAFSGELRVGKDTAADYVKTRKYPKLGHVHSESIAFAAPLYAILWYACDLLGFERTKNRNFLQSVGDWARSVDIDIFVKKLLQDVDKAIERPRPVSVPETPLGYIYAFCHWIMLATLMVFLGLYWRELTSPTGDVDPIAKSLTILICVVGLLTSWAEAALKPTLESSLIMLVTDVRMKNEAKVLKDNDFKLVRIERDRDRRVGYVPTADNAQHWTEKDLHDYDGFDITIQNNGTKEELYAQLDAMMKKWGFE